MPINLAFIIASGVLYVASIWMGEYGDYIFGDELDDSIEKIKVYATGALPELNKSLISESLQGTVIGGIIGFGSAVGADIIKRWITRPKISITKETVEVLVRPWQSVGMNEEWTATRIKTKNNGSTAAEDCKAYLITDNDEFRIAWMIPKEDRTVVINAHDVEYIDLCVFRKAGSSSAGPYSFRFTTERGYGETILDSRDLKSKSNLKLKVSARNANHSIKNIKMLNVPDSQNKVVHFQ